MAHLEIGGLCFCLSSSLFVHSLLAKLASGFLAPPLPGRANRASSLRRQEHSSTFTIGSIRRTPWTSAGISYPHSFSHTLFSPFSRVSWKMSLEIHTNNDNTESCTTTAYSPRWYASCVVPTRVYQKSVFADVSCLA